MSSDDQSDKECPLCMEAFDIDDINFFPCNCQYQICRFCWHRIRTNENGLCPACRQSYPEDPVNFQPLSSADLQKIKTEKKQKVQQQKNRVVESRKHLSEFRVLQKNLVYAVGLSRSMADPDLLRKPEYFGKFGKIIKVAVGAAPAINSSQPAVHTAYITYARSEDALRAIHAVHNTVVDGRMLKASLGTTKYCSNFLKGQQCHKPECMYLHEVAEGEISFTKEDMHQGKHTEYERRLHEQMASSSGNHNSKSQQYAPPPLQQQSSFGSGRELAAMRNRATANANNSNNRAHRDKNRVGGGGSLESLPNATIGGRKATALGAKQRARGGGASKWTASEEQQKAGGVGRGGSEARDLRNSRKLEHAKWGDSKRSCSNNNAGIGGKSVSPPITQTEADLQKQIQRAGSAEERHPTMREDDEEEEETPPMDPSPTPMTFSTGDGMGQWTESSSSPTPFPSSAPVLPQSPLENGILEQKQLEQQRKMAAKNYFLEEDDQDDDLGFDPFAESSKALEEIMEEEKNSTPPTTHLPNHLQNGTISEEHSSSSTHFFNNFYGSNQLNGAPPGLQNPSAFSSQHNNHNNINHFSGYNSMSDLRESFKAMLPNVNVRFVPEAAKAQKQLSEQQQQMQRQPPPNFGGGFYCGGSVMGGNANSSTSSLPALPSAFHGKGSTNRSSAFTQPQFRPFAGAPHDMPFQQQQHHQKFGAPPPIQPPPHHQFVQPSSTNPPPFGGPTVPSSSSFAMDGLGFQQQQATATQQTQHSFHNQQQHSMFAGTGGGQGAPFQHQQHHAPFGAGTASQSVDHNQYQQRSVTGDGAVQQQQDGWLPVPPGFSPRTGP